MPALAFVGMWLALGLLISVPTLLWFRSALRKQQDAYALRRREALVTAVQMVLHSEEQSKLPLQQQVELVRDYLSPLANRIELGSPEFEESARLLLAGGDRHDITFFPAHRQDMQEKK